MSEDNTRGEPVTVTTTPSVVQVDPQNPLPEPSFFWRRWIAIVICANALVFSWFAAAWLVGGEQWTYLYGLTRLLIYFGALVLTYYFVAPSASELTNMIQSASIIKKSLGVADTAAKQPAPAPQTAISARLPSTGSTDSDFPTAPSDGPEIDAAPRGRT